MHWADKIADDLIINNPGKESFVCAAGISPSGTIHIGNFRDVVTSYFVAKALRDRGKRVRLLFSWDDFDRFRKVPANIDPSYKEYIGRSYSDIPDPHGCHDSYAEHFEKEFESSLAAFGIDVEFLYQSKEYLSGRYSEQVIYAIQERKRIYDILMEYKAQESSQEERETFFPINLYCSKCKTDKTKIINCSADGADVEYVCKCGNKETVNLRSYFNVKLAWKIDWPMRWMAEAVDFEPGGKDHASPGGSYQVSSVISKQIFNNNAPYFQGYEFIGLKGLTGKMSGSSGLSLSPNELLKVYQPELILWLYAKTDPAKAFDFCFDDRILNHYFEFDKMLSDVRSEKATELVSRIQHYCKIEGREMALVPFSQIASFAPIVNFNGDLLVGLFERIGQNVEYSQIKERLERAKHWLETYSPESMIKLLTSNNVDLYHSLNDDERAYVTTLHAKLSEADYDVDEMQRLVYDIPKANGGSDKEIIGRQRRFFEIIYGLLIGMKSGPRLYLFLSALSKEKYLWLLDFK